MRIVLDTNVLVSGLLSPSGPPAEIDQWVAAGVLQLCLDWRIISEYRDVLQRPRFRFDLDRINDFLVQLVKNGIHVESFPALSNLPDQSDAAFLEVTLASTAEFLVTGNLKHFPARQRQGIQVVSPRKFIEVIKQKSSGL